MALRFPACSTAVAATLAAVLAAACSVFVPPEAEFAKNRQDGLAASRNQPDSQLAPHDGSLGDAADEDAAPAPTDAAPDVPAPDVPLADLGPGKDGVDVQQAPEVAAVDVATVEVMMDSLPAPDQQGPGPDAAQADAGAELVQGSDIADAGPDVEAADADAAVPGDGAQPLDVADTVDAADAADGSDAADVAPTDSGPDAPPPTCASGCSDNNPCTLDVCQASGTCANLPKAASCDDGNACTVFDTCAAGTCTALPKVCDDKNPCTSDTCEAATGCKFVNSAAPCVDGSACTTGETCSGGACKGGVPINCADADPCTSDVCNALQGCLHSGISSGPCDDANPCTSGEACKAGKCVGVVKNCDDGNACTTDSCSAAGCTHSPTQGACDDGLPCTINDTCASGTCAGKAGTVDADKDGFVAASCGGPDCNDSNPQVYPGAPELCDGLVNSCGAAVPFEPCTDLDGDGYCAAGPPVFGKPETCPKGGGDCSDDNPFVNPTTTLPCFGLWSPAGVAGSGPCDLTGVGTDLHMAWRGSVFDDMRYRRISGDKILDEGLVDRALGLGSPAVAVDGGGTVIVAYTNAATGSVVTSFRVAGTFRRKVLAMAKAEPVSLAVDGSGLAHLFYGGKDGAVWHAKVAAYKAALAGSYAGAELPSARATVTGKDGLVRALVRSTNGSLKVLTYLGNGTQQDVAIGGTADPAGGGAIAVGADGSLHVCFKSAAEHRLGWATNAKGTWQVQLAAPLGNYGEGCGIAVDPAGAVRIVYEAVGAKDLLSATISNGVWQFAPIAGAGAGGACGVQRTPAGQVVFSGSGQSLLRLVGDNWQITAMEVEPVCKGAADVQVDAKGAKHLVNWTWPSTCYGTDAAGPWQYGKITTAGASAATSRPRLAISSKDARSLAFTGYSGSESVLYHAALSGTTWQASAVWTWPGSGDGYGYPGVRFALQGDDLPVILVLPQTSSTYSLAQLVAGAWKISPTSATGVAQNAGDKVAFAWTGQPHIMYCSSAGQLRYATAKAGQWSTTTVDADGCEWVLMTAEAVGTATAIYSTGKSIQTGHYDGTYWTISNKNAPALPLHELTASMSGHHPDPLQLVFRNDVAVQYGEAKLGQPFVFSPIMPASCLSPTVQVTAKGKVVVACDARMIGAVP